MTKKLIGLLVAAMMLLSIIPAAAFAGTASRAAAPAVKDQTQVALWDLEADPLENGWEFRDEDGDNNNWQWINETYSGAPIASSGEYSIRSRSYFGTALTPDNWAVSPAVELPEAETIELSVQVASYLGYYPETFALYAFVDGAEEPVALGDDMQSPASSREFVEYTADLSEYAGQSVQVAVRHYNCQDQYMMYVDDIAIVADPEENPVDPTEPPVDPTEPPADPTEPPVDPTEPPVDPTEPPAESSLIAGYYFESEDELADWTLIGTADTGWVHSDNNPSNYPYGSLAHEGSGFIMSYSFVDYVGAYQANNWAISPAVELPEGSASLSFYATNANVAYPEAFDVYIGTSDETAEMTLLQGNISPNTGYEDEWTHYEFDLSEYAGQTVYVAFYDHCYDMYEIWLDQVEFFGEGGDQPPVDPTEPPVDPTEPPVVDDHKIVGYYFETDPEEEGWEFVDQDGDGNNWQWMADVSYYAYEGSGSIASNSYLSGSALTPDNWALSPELELRAANNSVTFYAFGRGGETYGYEHFAVYAGTDIDNMTEVLAEQITETSYQQYTVDLTGYENQTVRIAIRHFNCTNMYAINVDQFEVWGEEGSDPVDPELIPITEVRINGYESPVAGEESANHLNLTVPADANYTISPDGFDAPCWWNNDTDLFFVGTFEEGINYSVGLTLIANEGYYFAEDCAVIINDGEVEADPEFTGINTDDDTMFYVWTMPEAAAAPAPTLDEALNVEGGELHFESEGAYPWIVVEENDRLYAQSGNAGVSSSDSILTTTITANAGDVVSFEYKAFGEGTSTYWDYCEFLIDGERAGYWGAQQNDWEIFTSEPLTAGEHTLTWKYHKDGSVNPNGDFFAVDNVEITEGELPVTGILGDLDMDGEVTTADALMALRYVMGLIELNEDQLAQADVTGEGEVTVADPLLILRHTMGLIESFPAEEP